MEPSTAADARPPRHCIKCGREIGPDESICEVCNRAGMATPSASQYHGTMVVAIITGVIGLAIWATLATRGVGPYQASVVSFATVEGDAVSVTVQVSNQGTNRGTPICNLTARDAAGVELRSAGLVTSQVDGGQSATFTGRIPGLAEAPAAVLVSCR